MYRNNAHAQPAKNGAVWKQPGIVRLVVIDMFFEKGEVRRMCVVVLYGTPCAAGGAAISVPIAVCE